MRFDCANGLLVLCICIP